MSVFVAGLVGIDDSAVVVFLLSQARGFVISRIQPLKAPEARLKLPRLRQDSHQDDGKESDAPPRVPFVPRPFSFRKGDCVSFPKGRDRKARFPDQNGPNTRFFRPPSKQTGPRELAIARRVAFWRDETTATRLVEEDPLRPRRLLSRQLLSAEEGRSQAPDGAAMAAKIAKKDNFREQMCVITRTRRCETWRRK